MQRRTGTPGTRRVGWPNRRQCTAALASALLAPWRASFAQAGRAVRMVVPFPPGGSADAAARVVALQLARELGAPVVVDNRAGAAGNIGAEAVAKAPADGTTLLYCVGSIVTSNPWLYGDLRFDPMKDLKPVGVTNGGGGFVLLVPAASPVSTLDGFVAQAKKQPGRLNYASYGSGSAVHLAMELLKQREGIHLTHIPYRGAAPAMQALLAGDVDVMFDTLVNSQGHVRSGKLKALAVTSRQRMPQLPGVPAIAETRPGFSAEGWHGLFVPAATPQETVAALNAAIGKVMAVPEVDRWFTENGMQPARMGLDEFGAFVRADHEKWGRVIRAAKVQLQ